MMRVAIYSSPLRAIRNPTGVGQHIRNMIRELACTPHVGASLLATRSDYSQVQDYLPESVARLPVDYLPSAERLVRAALISTRLASIERWTGAVDWVYSPKEQPVATKSARLAVTIHDVLPFETNLSGLHENGHH